MEGTILTEGDKHAQEGRTQETLKGHKRAWKIKTRDTEP